MQEKLLYNLIEDLAGEGNGRIVEILFNKKDVNEFLIAKKMELTINQVRNILYKLSNHGLVSFIRKKDKKKGWYIYYWTLNTEKSLALIEQFLKKKISNFNEQLNNRQTKRYYTCPYCQIEVTEDIALEHGFSCEECAEIYELSINTPHIRDIKTKTTRTTRELDQIKAELEVVREKLRKKKERAIKKADKEAEAKKQELKEERAEIRRLKKIAEEKLNPKKISAKKKVTPKKTPVKKKIVKKTPIKKNVVKKTSSNKKVATKISVKK